MHVERFINFLEEKTKLEKQKPGQPSLVLPKTFKRILNKGRANVKKKKKRGKEWRIALSNHYAWLQTRGWRMHERKHNSRGSEKGLEN